MGLFKRDRTAVPITEVVRLKLAVRPGTGRHLAFHASNGPRFWNAVSTQQVGWPARSGTGSHILCSVSEPVPFKSALASQSACRTSAQPMTETTLSKKSDWLRAVAAASFTMELSNVDDHSPRSAPTRFSSLTLAISGRRVGRSDCGR
jgi:hypothetical protein